jgi:mannose-6-phosphate isomerase-like protein (cupin superfamily)
METTHGTWGVRTRTFETNDTLVTILRLKPQKRCSWHSHKTAYNQFYVIEGKLGVKTDIGPDDQRQVTVINPGQSFTVAPGVTHQFMTHELPTVIEEIAYVRYDSSDIHRKQLGGDYKEID